MWHKVSRASTYDLPPLPPGVKEPPPAQGGIQILGKGDGVDVPVKMLHKFQQLSEFLVPPVSVLCQSVGHSSYATETDTHCAVIGMVVDGPVVVQTGASSLPQS